MPCRHPGCAELVQTGQKYCPRHKPFHPEETRSAGKRGYGREWQKARRVYLASHPLCVICQKEGRYRKATVVDHIIPHRGDEQLFWDQGNWQALCKMHHDLKTGNEDSRPTYKY